LANVRIKNQVGLLSTVPPPEGAERGPIEKFAPPATPKLGVRPKIFRFSLTETPPPYKSRKFRENDRAHFREKNFRNFDENLIFWELGGFPIREKFRIDAPQALYQ